MLFREEGSNVTEWICWKRCNLKTLFDDTDDVVCWLHSLCHRLVRGHRCAPTISTTTKTTTCSPYSRLSTTRTWTRTRPRPPLPSNHLDRTVEVGCVSSAQVIRLAKPRSAGIQRQPFDLPLRSRIRRVCNQKCSQTTKNAFERRTKERNLRSFGQRKKKDIYRPTTVCIVDRWLYEFIPSCVAQSVAINRIKHN